MAQRQRITGDPVKNLELPAECSAMNRAPSIAIFIAVLAEALLPGRQGCNLSREPGGHLASLAAAVRSQRAAAEAVAPHVPRRPQVSHAFGSCSPLLQPSRIHLVPRRAEWLAGVLAPVVVHVPLLNDPRRHHRIGHRTQAQLQ